jgi:hypothetical protein
MTFGPFGAFMAAAAAQRRIRHVASGAQTSLTLNPASKGAQVGDLIYLFSPASSGSPSSPGFIPSGSGWSPTHYTYAIGLVTTFTWKVLDSTDAITAAISGANLGFAWGIYDGPETAAIVIANDTDSAGADTEHAVTWPSKNAACVGLLALGYQPSSASSMSGPVGWTKRVHSYTNTGGNPMAVDAVDTLRPPTGGHSTTFAGTYADNGTAPHRLIGVELRT